MIKADEYITTKEAKYKFTVISLVLTVIIILIALI
jgi:hypothetical protein